MHIYITKNMKLRRKRTLVSDEWLLFSSRLQGLIRLQQRIFGVAETWNHWLCWSSRITVVIVGRTSTYSTKLYYIPAMVTRADTCLNALTHGPWRYWADYWRVPGDRWRHVTHESWVMTQLSMDIDSFAECLHRTSIVWLHRWVSLSLSSRWYTHIWHQQSPIDARVSNNCPIRHHGILLFLPTPLCCTPALQCNAFMRRAPAPLPAFEAAW